MNDGAEFDLFWTPRDTIVPKLHLSARDEDVDVPLDAEVQVVSSTEGAARLRFTGRPPELPWSFVASRDPTRDIDCIGFDSCVLDSDYSVDLQPGGISPIVPADTPWPRNCIAGPTRSQRDYVSRVSSYFPDLSSVHVARHEDCDSADLYFALLGACAVPDGGKSTYVVGNRGTRATRFAVQSNQEGVVGGTLEPQQLSKPFEIAFSGPSSKLEIFVDDDCDLTSNSVDVDVSNTP
jgi:hypothetical protein